jgi:hypothetical protein
MSEESRGEYDREKLDWLISTDNVLKSHWDDTPHKTGPLNGLAGVREVENMHPNHRGEFVYLTDINDFGQIIRFMYQIRCNLFHGGKSPAKPRDRDLTRWSAMILDNWLTWTLLKIK